MIPEVLVKEHLNQIVTSCEHESYCKDVECNYLGANICRADIPEGEHHAAITLAHIIGFDRYKIINHWFEDRDTDTWYCPIYTGVTIEELVTKYFESIKNK